VGEPGKKYPPLPEPAANPVGVQHIRLQNPVREHFEAFIAGNATVCQRDPPHTKGDKCEDEECTRMVELDSAKGQTVVICGAGPTLRDHAAKWCPQGDQLWGCNSAATWLAGHGHRPTHAITVDQTEHMAKEWAKPLPVEYIVATSIHPDLTQQLQEQGARWRWFHNYVGIEKPPVEYCECGHDRGDDHCAECGCTEYRGRAMVYEDWLYAQCFPPTIRAGSGLNTVTRAIDVALFMGFERIILLGADCALRARKRAPRGTVHGTPAHRKWLREQVEMHADGGHALASEATETTIEGRIDGRYWLTKADMMITAVWLVKWRRILGRKVLTIIGDTLPNALQDKDDAFLERLPAMVDVDGKPLQLI